MAHLFAPRQMCTLFFEEGKGRRERKEIFKLDPHPNERCECEFGTENRERGFSFAPPMTKFFDLSIREFCIKCFDDTPALRPARVPWPQ